MTSAHPASPSLSQHAEFVHGLARALLRGDPESEDVAQDVLAAALEGPARPLEHQRSWLARAVRHRVVDLVRRRARRHARERAAARPEAVAPAADPVERAEAGRKLVEAVLVLGEPGRRTLILRYQENLSPPEIAARLAVPLETVRTRLRRALAQLRSTLRAADHGRKEGWYAALVPLVDLGHARPAGGPPFALGGALMTKHAWLPAILLLGLGGAGAWRLSELSRELEVLREAQTLVGSRQERGAAPLAPASAATGPALEGAAPPPDGARLDRLERAIEGLLARWKQREAAWEDVEQVLSELLAARTTANETTAVASCRNVISAMAQAQATARVDEDRDGTGEYPGFLESSGAIPGRMPRALVPPVLASAFKMLTANGEVLRSGYLYRVYLPDAHGAGVGEPSGGFAPGMLSPDLAETTWCLYAWPDRYGKTGTRTFFVNQGGDTLATDAPAYSGSGHGPDADAAFQPSHRGGIVGLPAVGGVGADGNVWKQVN